MEPDHPMVVEGGVLPGDTQFMFECMVEEFLREGTSSAQLERMMQDPNYQALYAAVETLGIDMCKQLLADAARRVGRHRVLFAEAIPMGCQHEEFPNVAPQVMSNIGKVKDHG
ncbi:hypothetical protein IT570_05510 [Candidatus Sumerlaeota bacterium]|nr:hypothetical protein [Candidatus Sumerlaeota bacterium]